MTATEPDLADAIQLFHHRDAALDEPWGEGVDVTVYRLPDGRFYQEHYRYHIDFDGSRDHRVLTVAQAIEAMADVGGSARAAELFPDQPEARWFQRYGTCRWYDLDAGRVWDHARLVWRVDGPPGEPPVFSAVADPDGLWVLDVRLADGGRDRALARPERVLERLLDHGCPLDVLARAFPDAGAVRILRRVGASTWAEASVSGLPALMATSSLVCDAHADGARQRLVRLGADELLLERAEGGHVAFMAKDDLGAAEVLLRLGADAATWRRVFPDPAAAGGAVREIQRRAGISFPG